MSGNAIDPIELQWGDDSVATGAMAAADALMQTAAGLDRVAGSSGKATNALSAAQIQMQQMAAAQGGLGPATQSLAGANTVLHGTFDKNKQVMKEVAQMGDNLIGQSTGLSGVIRGAMNPAFLAMALAAMAVGKAVEAYKEQQERLRKTLEESVTWVENYSKALDENAGKLLTFSEFQKGVAKTGAELMQIDLENKIDTQTESLEAARAEWQKYNVGIYNTVAQVRDFKERGIEMDAIMKSEAKSMREAKANYEASTQKLAELNFMRAHGGLTTMEFSRQEERLAGIMAGGSVKTREAYEAQRKLAEGTAQLDAMLKSGVLSADNYAAALAKITAAIKLEGEARHKGATVVNAKKAMYEQLSAFETKAIADSSQRQIAGINSELAKLKEGATKAISDRRERIAFIANLERAAQNQIAVIMAAEVAANKKVNDQIRADDRKMFQDEFNDRKKTSDDRMKFQFQTEMMQMARGRRTSTQQVALVRRQAQEEVRIIRKMVNEKVLAAADGAARIAAINGQANDAAAEILRLQAEQEREANKARVENAARAVVAMFGNNKGVAKAVAAVDMMRGIMADVALGWPMMIPAIIFTTAVGVKTMQDIDSAKPPSVEGSAGGGLDRVPNDMTMYVHKNEMIVPKDPAEIIRSFAQTVKKQGGAGGQTVNMMGNWYDGEQSLRDMGRRQNRIKQRMGAGRRH